MEFLDDLRQQRESKVQPEAQPEAQPPTPAHPAPELAQDPGAWDDLLASVNVVEPEVAALPASLADRHTKSASAERALTPGQKLFLGILSLCVLASWIAVIVLISRSIRNAAIVPQPPVTSITTEATAVGKAESIAADAIPTEPAENIATVAPRPTATLIPTGPVATTYDERIRRDPSNPDLYIQRGEAYLAAGAYQAALDDFQRAQELDADRAEIYEGAGWTYYALFRWTEAEAAFNKAIELDPELAEAYFGRGKMLYYRGDYKPAATNFDTAADIDPHHAEYEAWLAMSAAQFDVGPEALGAATRAISASENLSIVYLARSWAVRTQDPAQSDTDDRNAAQNDLLHAMDLGPNDFLILNGVAEFYVAERPERLAEAEQLAAYALNWARNDVERAVAMQTLGRVYLLQDRRADAQRILAEATALASVDGEIALVGLTEDLARAHE